MIPEAPNSVAIRMTVSIALLLSEAGARVALIAPGSIPRSLLRTFNFEIWKLKCLGACPEDLYFGVPLLDSV